MNEWALMAGMPTNVLDAGGLRVARCDFDGDTSHPDAIHNAARIVLEHNACLGLTDCEVAAIPALIREARALHEAGAETRPAYPAALVEQMAKALRDIAETSGGSITRRTMADLTITSTTHLTLPQLETPPPAASEGSTLADSSHSGSPAPQSSDGPRGAVSSQSAGNSSGSPAAMSDMAISSTPPGSHDGERR